MRALFYRPITLAGSGLRARRKCHHGDLAVVLIAEGLRLLGQQRRVVVAARGVGVSATRSFAIPPEREALLTARAWEGLARFGAAQRVALEAAGGGEAAFCGD